MLRTATYFTWWLCHLNFLQLLHSILQELRQTPTLRKAMKLWMITQQALVSPCLIYYLQQTGTSSPKSMCHIVIRPFQRAFHSCYASRQVVIKKSYWYSPFQRLKAKIKNTQKNWKYAGAVSAVYTSSVMKICQLHVINDRAVQCGTSHHISLYCLCL